ncbi:hypothetical protein [Mycobacterium riyadhense]|uniref:Uncharacterized protein n=1 Tax=Mycobacterium riyadhense TaxID=486698 RepID=A0A1X2B9N3_9MYCO|nr:hypothetical protein [Mycobacterium riyadhense]MCV7148235.1 hypothetical protein [Mycobacterium riyadhense]ORW59989.1 hypothetical protein AWC22_05915 [Mycobacterium riyadhense]
MGKGARIRRERAAKYEQEGPRSPGRRAGANGGSMPPTAASVGGEGDMISQLMQFLGQQPQLMVCGQLGLKPLTDDKRRDLLDSVKLYDALETVACVQGQWDVAYTTTHRVDLVEGDFLAGGGTGGVCEKARNRIVAYGDHLISPRATAQLQREIIEYASTDEAAPSIDLDTLVHMLLSITSEQNSAPEFTGDVPTADEVRSWQRKLPNMGLEETHEYAKPHIQNEIASSLFNHPLKYEIVLSNTDDLWFTTWHPRSETTGLGATPAEAFKIATGVDLLDVMRLGTRIVKRSTDSHQVRFTRDELLADGATQGAIDLLFANMARLLDDYKVELQGDRDKGAIGNQRYTLTRFPFLAVDDNTFVMLRHQWALDRLCGGQLYFEAWASFSSGRLRNRFKIAMCDAFEVFAGGIVHHIFDKSPHLCAIADEDEMQAAWTEKKGEKPSVCDWMIFGNGHCIVIDATDRAVKEDAAQGLASWDEYSADVEKIFTDPNDGKFGQLLSTIDLVKKHGGWGSERVDTKTMFAPLVVVPDAGVVNGLLTQFDINVRGYKVFKHLQPQVYAPGIVPISDIQLLEGFADVGQKYGNNPDMMDMIAKWRTGASKYGLASLQLFLLSQGAPILPISDHIFTNSGKVMELLDGS